VYCIHDLNLFHPSEFLSVPSSHLSLSRPSNGVVNPEPHTPSITPKPRAGEGRASLAIFKALLLSLVLTFKVNFNLVDVSDIWNIPLDHP
jgi:hypothetical protein